MLSFKLLRWCTWLIMFLWSFSNWGCWFWNNIIQDQQFFISRIFNILLRYSIFNLYRSLLNTLFFIYHHISRLHHNFRSEIIYLICSTWCRIPKKEPFITFCIKFLQILSVSKDVTVTAKNSKIFHHRFLSSSKFIWGLLCIWTKIHYIQGMTCSVYSFSLEVFWHAFIV